MNSFVEAIEYTATSAAPAGGNRKEADGTLSGPACPDLCQPASFSSFWRMQSLILQREAHEASTADHEPADAWDARPRASQGFAHLASWPGPRACSSSCPRCRCLPCRPSHRRRTLALRGNADPDKQTLCRFTIFRITATGALVLSCFSMRMPCGSSCRPGSAPGLRRSDFPRPRTPTMSPWRRSSITPFGLHAAT